MHSQNIKINILCILSKELKESFEELKQHFSLNIVISKDYIKDILNLKYNLILFENGNFIDSKLTKLLNEKKNITKLCLNSLTNNTKVIFDDKLELPLNFFELNNRINQLVTKKKYNENSSIKIKNYILDKNEKKLIKENSFVILTEKEIQLLELLFFEQEPLKKNLILNKVWQYSSDADTHTVETHIYRLRKKIFKKFNDENLINNTKEGYFI